MKAIPILCFAWFLSACAAPRNPMFESYKVYMDENKPRAEQGSMLWSEYYKVAYSKALGANLPAYMLNGYIGLIDHALDYEAGKITKDQLDQFRRVAQANALAQSQEQRQRAQEQASARSAAALAAVVQINANQQAAQQAAFQSYQIVQPVQQPAPRALGGFLQTQSTSGTLKYCKYSNGAIVTVGLFEMCPTN